jgi:hypothetical protein
MFRYSHIIISWLLCCAIAACCPFAFAEKKKPPRIGYQLKPDQQAVIENPKIISAEQSCENWTWAAALDSLLKTKGSAMGQEYQILRLYGGTPCTAVKSYSELADKVSHEYVLDDGRRFLLQAFYTSGPPVHIDPLVVAMREQHPLMVIWKSHSYVLIGVNYDEYIGPNNARILELKELKLADPATGGSVSFVRGRDDSEEINGMMDVRVKSLQLYQMR